MGEIRDPEKTEAEKYPPNFKEEKIQEAFRTSYHDSQDKKKKDKSLRQQKGCMMN